MKNAPPTLFLLLFLTVCTTTDAWSSPPQDLEVSGDDQEIYGSGSGGGEVFLDEKLTPLAKDDTDNFKPAQKTFVKKQEVEPWDREATILQESRSFMENIEVLTGVIAGGVCGLMLALLLGGILIYKWQKKGYFGYIQGHREQHCYPDPDLREGHPDLTGRQRGEDVVLV